MYRLEAPLDDDPRIEVLDDGFERFGGRDTPFLLREGLEKRREARRIHQERRDGGDDENVRVHNEVTRDVDEWASNIYEFDFPFVDTIPHEEMVARSERALRIATDLGLVAEVDRECTFRSETLLGQFLPGVRLVELSPREEGFLGFREAVCLGHEVGHAFARELGPSSGISADETTVFPDGEQQADARHLSERLRGPIPTDVEGTHYREEASELFADAFAALVIEPERAMTVAPEATNRVERLLQEIDPRAGMIVDI